MRVVREVGVLAAGGVVVAVRLEGVALGVALAVEVVKNGVLGVGIVVAVVAVVAVELAVILAAVGNGVRVVAAVAVVAVVDKRKFVWTDGDTDSEELMLVADCTRRA